MSPAFKSVTAGEPKTKPKCLNCTCEGIEIAWKAALRNPVTNGTVRGPCKFQDTPQTSRIRNNAAATSMALSNANVTPLICMPLHTVEGVGVLRPPWAINSFRSPGTIHAVTPHLGGGG